MSPPPNPPPFDLCGVVFVPTVSITLLIGSSVEFLSWAHMRRNDGPMATELPTKCHESIAVWFILILFLLFQDVWSSRLYRILLQVTFLTRISFHLSILIRSVSRQRALTRNPLSPVSFFLSLLSFTFTFTFQILGIKLLLPSFLPSFLPNSPPTVYRSPTSSASC